MLEYSSCYTLPCDVISTVVITLLDISTVIITLLDNSNVMSTVIPSSDITLPDIFSRYDCHVGDI